MAKKIITLDPGHGKNGNKSPNNAKYIEGTQMWHLSVKLKAALELSCCTLCRWRQGEV